MIMVRMRETTCGSVPRRYFDLSQIEDVYGQRNDRSYFMEKLSWVLVAEPMAEKLFDSMDLVTAEEVTESN